MISHANHVSEVSCLTQTIRVGLNGFGRIGKAVFRAGVAHPHVEFVAINSRSDPSIYAHLLKYDSVHGRFPGVVELKGRHIWVNGKEVKMFQETDPINVPWKQLGVDVVIECTGEFRKRADIEKHLHAGAKYVVLTAPPKGDDTIPLYVYGVNHTKFDKKKDLLVSNASCTTNCLAPIAKVLNDSFGIKKGFMSTVHAYTSSQSLIDRSDKDLRRARAAGVNIIPTSTGAAKSIGKIIPELTGKLDGAAFRVPVPNGSALDLVVELNRNVTIEEVNQAIRKAAEGPFKGVIEYADAHLVSSDVLGNSHSAVFDSIATQLVAGNLVKILAWYDNEYGYSCRLIDLICYMFQQ